jgi:RNA polymerase sigma factor (sigma-70 family)
MAEADWLTDRFEASRAHLRAVAYRMLGSYSEADDAVQETWLRVNRADANGVGNFSGWLTTIVARICLDKLRSRRSRREALVGAHVSELAVGAADDIDPAHDALISDSIGSALLVVLDLLAPAERVAFVLHDIFTVPFDEIGKIVGRSPDAARQLASRARRRVQERTGDPDLDLARQREIVDAFLAAARGGDFDALLALLDPDIMVRADATAVRMGAPAETHGAATVARWAMRGARATQLALVDSKAGLVWAPGGRARGVLRCTIRDGKINTIDLVADPERMGQLDIVPIERAG